MTPDPSSRPSPNRRDFVKAMATGAAALPATAISTHVAFGQKPSPAPTGGAVKTAAPQPGAFAAPTDGPLNLIEGRVLRTQGKLVQGGKLLEESQRSIPVTGKAQVIVCGGGPAGTAAALAAARAGIEVRLIELAGCLGGVWTAGLLTKILDTGNKDGIMKEMLKRFAERGSDVARKTKGTVYDPEIAKVVLEEMLVEAGVKIMYHTRVVGAITDDRNKLSAILTESKAGRQAWVADRFIDCTGDGDLGAQAGCKFDVGIGSDCTCQPMSMLALLTGVDPDKIRPYIRETGSSAKPRLLKLMEDNGIKPTYRAPTLRHLHSGIYSIMTNHEYGVPAFDPDAVTEATIRARKEIHDIVNGMRKLGGPWKDLSVVATAEQIGVREGRRIRGRYHVTADDLANGLRHKQAVCRAAFPIDVHALNKKGNMEVDHSWRKKGLKPYDIPYPALVAADVDGLLMAGRNISGDFIAHSSYRVTGNSVAMGEAAGIGAAESIKRSVLPHEIDWAALRGKS